MHADDEGLELAGLGAAAADAVCLLDQLRGDLAEIVDSALRHVTDVVMIEVGVDRMSRLGGAHQMEQRLAEQAGVAADEGGPVSDKSLLFGLALRELRGFPEVEEGARQVAPLVVEEIGVELEGVDAPLLVRAALGLDERFAEELLGLVEPFEPRGEPGGVQGRGDLPQRVTRFDGELALLPVFLLGDVEARAARPRALASRCGLPSSSVRTSNRA